MYHGLPLNSQTHTAFVKSLIYQITYYHIMFIVDTQKLIRHNRFFLKIHFHYVIKVFLLFFHFRSLKLPESGQTQKENPTFIRLYLNPAAPKQIQIMIVDFISVSI